MRGTHGQHFMPKHSAGQGKPSPVMDACAVGCSFAAISNYGFPGHDHGCAMCRSQACLWHTPLCSRRPTCGTCRSASAIAPVVHAGLLQQSHLWHTQVCFSNRTCGTCCCTGADGQAKICVAQISLDDAHLGAQVGLVAYAVEETRMQQSAQGTGEQVAEASKRKCGVARASVPSANAAAQRLLLQHTHTC